jgi:predicted AlkP superfamily pyrophosphatase or phosphodiesterase
MRHSHLPRRLLVILVVDQFRADYLERFGPWLGEDGFRRLQREGTQFANARYRHAITQTAAGHAQMSTGAFAERHGIIGNDWLDRDEWAMVNSVEDTSSPLVGVTPAELGPEAALAPAKSGRSPRHLMIDTLADALKARDGDRCRVVSVSAKDRRPFSSAADAVTSPSGKRRDVSFPRAITAQPCRTG